MTKSLKASKMKFKDKVAIVTGASRGIGRAIAQEVACHGGHVGLVARSVDGLETTRELILHDGGKAWSFPIDLRNEQEISQLVSKVSETLGVVDMLVNCAGVWHNQKKVYLGPHLEDTPPEQIDEVLDVGIRAPMLLTRLFLPGMIQKRRGKILQISGGFSGTADAVGWLHYYVSKKALEHFTEGLAEELREHEIQVNCISPWFVNTDPSRRFFPEKAKFAISPIEIAKFAIFLLSEKADHISGSVIPLRDRVDY